MKFTSSALFFILIITTIIAHNEGMESNVGEKKAKRLKPFKLRWTKELNRKIIDIWMRSGPGTKGQGARMLELWRAEVKEYPGVTTDMLRSRVWSIRRGVMKVPDIPPIDPKLGQRRIKWTYEMNSYLNKIFKSTYGPDRSKRIHEKFIQKYKLEKDVTPEYLIEHARKLKNAGFLDGEEGLAKYKIISQRHYWTPEEDLDLMKIWNEVYVGACDDITKKIYNKWRQKYQGNDDITVAKVNARVGFLLKKGFTIPAEHPGGDEIKLDLALRRARGAHSQLLLETPPGGYYKPDLPE